jgi:hypothetical protein
VKRILSVKWRQETSVSTPCTRPAECLLLIGNGVTSTPSLIVKPLRFTAVDEFDIFGVCRIARQSEQTRLETGLA